MKNREVLPAIIFDESLIRKNINFEVEGKPFGKQRPRVIHRGGFSRAYTPPETVAYEKKVKNSYENIAKNIQMNKPIEANIIGIFPVPKSISNKKRNYLINNKIHHISKPDCDNIAKSILDALNGVAYKDDSQICKLSVEKYYGKVPKVIVSLKEIE